MTEQEIKAINKKIFEQCGNDPIADGMECPHCGNPEVVKNKENPDDTTKWYFLIKANRIDNHSKCTICGTWF